MGVGAGGACLSMGGVLGNSISCHPRDGRDLARMALSG